MGSADPEQSPIFVVGNSRSGTTLLRMMLSAHPRIHLTMEASFYVWGALYTRWRDPDAFPPYYVRSFSFRWLREDPREVLRDLPRPFRREDRRLLYGAVMRTAARRHGKERFGDKTPGHSAHLGDILADWPDARIVRTLRDPREAVGSLVRMPWSSASLAASAAIVDHERRQVAPYRDRILEVHLAELVREPEAVMRRVLEHVGEDWSDRVLDHPAHAPDDLPPMPWFTSAGTERASADRASKRSDRVDPAELRLMERLSRAALREQGLAPAALASEPGWLAVASRYLRDLPELARSVVVGAQLVAASRDSSDHARTQRLLRKLNPAAWAALGDFEMPEPPPLPEGWESAWP